MLPYTGSVSERERSQGTPYHSPKNALQLQDQILILTFKTVFPYEQSKLGEVTLFLQHLAAKLCFCHNTVEVWW